VKNENNFEMRTVMPTLPPAAWIGGKRKLAKRLVALIDTIPHTGYIEPFIGMGGIFLRRTSAPRFEVINDLSTDVVTLFRVLQRHYQPFMDMLKWQITSRAEFERLSKCDPATLTDLERAARFLYLQKISYGGRVNNRSFAVGSEKAARFNITTLAPLLQDVHERLSGVVIDNLPYDKLILKHDREGMLFYLDPPYYDCEGYYGKDIFSKTDFEQLATLLSTLKGRFILSINDRPEVREIFKAFTLEQVEVGYSINGGAQAKFKELIIQSTP
jgi:DNA adenine methylase